ncbi:MAG TPA: hypothetical protein VNT58_10980 [Gaiellaceae bacterium]|nr:hypothetical protein [Gaiellaceae bacterium]
MQVAADEFRYALSRQTIPAGPALVELVNYGEDDHDLRLRRAGGTRTYAIGRVAPAAVRQLEARLAPGRFTLWCAVPGHRGRGMTATLVVRRP